ncbi:HhH-GPD family protein [Arthrobacter sedimenti]|uniref:A/G-specific adenine glycosylase n=1 Tax=Arthrobacter sedimenti TaxID=2694931 RepID=UPI000B3643DB|nr:A/G-specific adenine glycosylase [Arthrobacter sedimenti]OUM43870.1 Fe-S cluster assembly protein HesB [Arthrobacter agilis]
MISGNGTTTDPARPAGAIGAAGAARTERRPDDLHARVADWFAEAARDLPWRDPDCSPWGILVSEVMLQQTPVVRVLPVWREWLERWPSPAHLAAEPSGAAVRHWGRLGYPRRALRLHAAATAMVADHGGAVPTTYDELLSLPGVGTYTAAAVAAFAFGRRETVVDTNIRRVQARVFGGSALPAPALTAAEMKRARELLPADDALSVRWNAAVMELGAVICTARSPLCDACPVLDACSWVAAGRPAPEYVPKGQSWAGTDRQVRGAIVAVLRDAEMPVPRSILLESPVDLTMGGPSAPGRPPRPAALTTLHGLQAPAEQLERALAGLLADGLAEDAEGGIRLPG